MIVDSTPSCIRLGIEGRTVTFPGEWSSPYRIGSDGELEPTGEVSRFYLEVPIVMYWDPPNERSRLSAREVSKCIDVLLRSASDRGWVVLLPEA